MPTTSHPFRATEPAHDAPHSADGLHVRVATTAEDRERIFRFRYEVYVREMGKPLATADHAAGRLPDPADEGAILFFVDAPGEDRVLGTLRLHAGNLPTAAASRLCADQLACGPEQVAFVSKTMVGRDRRGSLVFLALARAAYAEALAAGIRFGLLHCRPSLVPLYTRLGYRRHGSPFVDPEVGEQIPMVLDLQMPADSLRGRHSPGRAA